MRFFSLQVSLTDRCNLACRHCYRAALREDAPIERWGKVLSSFKAFSEKLGLTGIVSFTGGEPLLCEELGVLVRLVRLLGMHARLATNGLLLDAERARSLKQWGLEMVQVSLDGARPETHDSIRGTGAFEKALKGLRNAKAAGLLVNIKATMLPNGNLSEVEDYFALANREGIPTVSFGRLIPIGEGAQFRALTSQEHFSWIEAVARESQRSPFAKGDVHEPGCDRSYLPQPYLCGIGENYLAIDSDGTVYPCRRLPVKIGNCFEDSFEEIWKHPLLEGVRSLDFGGACGTCELKAACRGGCRAAAMAQGGNPLASDPSCWYVGGTGG